MLYFIYGFFLFLSLSLYSNMKRVESAKESFVKDDRTKYVYNNIMLFYSTLFTLCIITALKVLLLIKELFEVYYYSNLLFIGLVAVAIVFDAFFNNLEDALATMQILYRVVIFYIIIVVFFL